MQNNSGDWPINRFDNKSDVEHRLTESEAESRQQQESRDES
jgi:hypothetical protein